MKKTILLYIFKLPFYKEILNNYAYIYLTFFFSCVIQSVLCWGVQINLTFKENPLIGILGKHGKV